MKLQSDGLNQPTQAIKLDCVRLLGRKLEAVMVKSKD